MHVRNMTVVRLNSVEDFITLLTLNLRDFALVSDVRLTTGKFQFTEEAFVDLKTEAIAFRIFDDFFCV